MTSSTSTAAAPPSAAVDGDGEAPSPMRIFIGGVGAAVTAADIEKTFTPMGHVSGVDIVRTNDRSFAYMDFTPLSDRALAKLFSTYNGCMWKGGKLKLEKAKEHYLTRLKKEWEEDANLVATPPANPIAEKSTGPVKKFDLLKQENMQLKIFFPNLRKVKSIPFKGTGKHKYSFQRIEVPPLPIHFCDCEEHCGPYEKSCEKYQSTFDKVINEKELNVMNSVMNKLLEKEGTKTAGKQSINSARDANTADSLVDNILPEEAEADQGTDGEAEDELETDEDNLVTNITMRGRSKGHQAKTPLKETSFRKTPPLKDQFTKTTSNSERKKRGGPTGAAEVMAGENFHPMSVEKTVEDEFTAILSRKVRFPEPEMIEEAPPVESETEMDLDTSESRKGNSWLHNSSWKDLVGKKDSSSFDFSHLLSGSTSVGSKTVKTTDSAISMSSASKKKRKVRFDLDAEPRKTSAKKRKAKSDKEEPSSTPLQPNIMLEKAIELNHLEISKEEDEIEENPKGATEPHANSNAENRRIEDTSVPFSSTTVISECHSQAPEVITDPPRPTMDTVLPKDNTWFQKSTWKDLVTGNTNSSFSISALLPDFTTPASNLPKAGNSSYSIPTAAANMKAQSDEDKTYSIQAMENTLKQKAVGLCSVTESQVKDVSLGNSKEPEVQVDGDVVPRKTRPKVVSTKGSTFMRSDESLKEWKTVRQALSGFMGNKNKNGEKNMSMSSKGMPSRKAAPRSSTSKPSWKH